MVKKGFVVVVLCLMIFSLVLVTSMENDLTNVQPVDLSTTSSVDDSKEDVSQTLVDTADTQTTDLGVVEEVKDIEKSEEVIIAPPVRAQFIERERTIMEARPVVEPIAITPPFRQLQLVIEVPLSKRAETIRELKADDFRAFQREMLMVAVDRCSELDKDVELCRKKLRERLELVKRLESKDIEIVQKIAEKNAKAVSDVAELGRAKAFVQFDKEKEFKARLLPQEKVEDAQRKFREAKLEYTESIGKYDEAKSKLEKLELKKEKCDGMECESVEVEQKIEAKEMQMHAAENVLKSLEQTRAKIEEAEFLTENEVSAYMAQLDDETLKIAELKKKVEAFDENTLKEDINVAFRELRKAVINGKMVIRKSAGRLISARIGAVVVKAKHLEIKLNRVLERMAENGKIVAEIEPLIEKFNTRLESAKINYEKARNEWAKVGENAEVLDYPQEYMDHAKKDVTEAQRILQDIMLQILLNHGEDELAEIEVVEEAIESATEIGEVS